MEERKGGRKERKKEGKEEGDLGNPYVT